MSHTPKSKYVGDHGGKYTALDGMSKQFTYVDHDKKTMISFQNVENEDFSMSDYRKNLITRITELPASICPDVFVDFTLHGDRSIVAWNMPMLEDEGLPISRLRDLCVILENKAEAMRLIP